MTEVKKRAKYLKGNGKQCPHCNSKEIRQCEADVQETAIYVAVVCNECKKEWTDTYTLTDVTFDIFC